jgi:hypothetical protein
MSDTDILEVRESDLFWREVDGKILLLDGKSWEYLQLNSSGDVLWKCLVDGASKSQLITKLVELYGIDKAQATTDVGAFIDRLTDLDLLAS